MPDTPTPDLASGVALTDLPDGATITGQVGGEDVLLLRRGDEFFAVGAFCTHYHGPLADGLVAGDTLRCPWHHACFSLRTGEALRAPALDPIACWRVERIGDTVFVRERLPAPDAQRRAPSAASRSAPPVRRHRRRRCRGTRGGGQAAPRRLRRRRDDALRRRFTAVRPAEPVEGLSRGHRTGRLDTAACPRVLRRAPHRAQARFTGRRHRRGVEARAARRRQRAFVRRAAARDRRRAGASRHPRCDRRAGALSAHVRRQPGDRRQGERSEARGRRRRQLHRARGRRGAATPAGSTCTSSARKASRWSACWVRTWGASSASCTRRTVSCSTWAAPSVASTARG